MPIRILHVVDNLGIGGMQNGLANLVGHLDPERFEHVCCAMRPVREEDLQPFPRDRAQSFCLRQRNRSRSQVAALAFQIHQTQPNIVHSRNWGAIEAVVAARMVGSCAVIHSEHGLDSETAPEPRYRPWFRRLAFGMAHRVFAVSYHLRALHASRTGFPASRMRVIHNGVDDRRFYPDSTVRAAIRRELGLADGFCIGAVGNLTPVKDHLTLLKAVELCAGGIPGWRLVLAGDGPERAALEAFAAARPEWRGRILFLGRTRRVPELLKALDAYVLPSLTEGICNALLEAMASGLPVVVTATGGNPEVVDNQSGLVFPVGDCRMLAEHLRALHGSGDLRNDLGRRALQRVQSEFSIQAMVRNYDEMYTSLAPASVAAAQAVVGA
jgi:sugar transferase (PEP-CTERM/EpsH1 system associated)